jgi:hypothetical protein
MSPPIYASAVDGLSLIKVTDLKTQHPWGSPPAITPRTIYPFKDCSFNVSNRAPSDRLG